jgi:hypothetical protein
MQNKGKKFPGNKITDNYDKKQQNLTFIAVGKRGSGMPTLYVHIVRLKLKHKNTNPARAGRMKHELYELNSNLCSGCLFNNSQ